MSREAQAVVLFLLGGALTHAAGTDLYLRYVKAELRPLLLAAGIVLIVAAVATTWYEWRPQKTARGGHDHREPRISWILLLPLLGLGVVAPPALGSFSATAVGTALRKSFDVPAELPPTGPLRLGVLDYAGRAVYDHGRSLAGRPITLTGFITIGRDGEPYLTRMMLNCCAADAQPIKIQLSGQVPPVLQPDTWFAVTGTYTGALTTDPLNGGPVPFLDVTRADPVAVPAQAYETW